jgi:putative endonuclease
MIFIRLFYLDAMWYYVYILELNNGKHYVGCTINVKERFTRHKKGYVSSTKHHLPAKLLWCCSFSDRYKAYEFERYLKSGSGRAFATKHLY